MFGESPLQQALPNVPEEIRSWIGSEKITYFLMRLNDQLGLKDERARIIPRLLLRLEVKDVHPAGFTDALSQELQIGPGAAKSIAAELVENALKPIEPALAEWGADIDLIDIAGAGPLTTMVRPTPETKPAAPPRAPLPLRELPSVPSEPLILHKEEREELEKSAEAERKSFTLSPFGGGFFDKKPSPQKMHEVKPAARVVHYSEHRTPLGNAGLNGQGFIDLSKIGASAKGPEDKAKPAPPPVEGPMLNGNTVDLRRDKNAPL